MYELSYVLDLGRNGGETILFADVNGDGHKEMLIRQSGEIYGSRHNRRPEFKENISQENADLFQLTCMTQAGRVLWQRGKPWPHDSPYTCHGGSEMTRVLDYDGDGRMEVLAIHQNHLVILDAATGRELRSLELPTDALNIVHIQHLGAEGYRFLLKSNSFSEWGYGQPLFTFDEELVQVGEPVVVPGGGHNIVLRDVDGDGKEEIFVGYSLLDHDRSVLYQFDFGSHVDSIYVRDLDEDGVDEVVYNCDNERFVVVNVKGEHLFEKTEFAHPQAAHIGKLMAEVPGLQIFLNNRGTHGGSFMMDCRGEVLWDFPCNGYSSLLGKRGPGGTELLLHRPNPGRLAWNPALEESLVRRAEELGYRDLPIRTGAPHEPFVIDGHGKVLFRFPGIEGLDPSPWGVRKERDPFRMAGLVIGSTDVDGCGTEEVLFHDRTRLWVFRAT